MTYERKNIVPKKVFRQTPEEEDFFRLTKANNVDLSSKRLKLTGNGSQMILKSLSSLLNV